MAAQIPDSGPDLGPSAELLYDRTAPLWYGDRAQGFVGKHLCDALMAMLQGTDQIVLDIPAVPAGAGRNLVPNPSFEYGTATSGGWAAYPAGTSEVFEVQSGWAASGEKSLRVKATSTGAAQSLGATMEPSNKVVAVTSGASYGGRMTVNVLTNTTPSASVALILEVFDAAGTYITGLGGVSVAGTGAKSILIPAVTVPANAVFMRPTVVASATAAGQVLDMYVDAVQISPLAISPGGVPAYLDGDDPLYRWEGTVGNSASGPAKVVAEHPGWTTALDPATAPAAWLPWSAQVYGVTLPPGVSTEEARRIIKELGPQKRGTIASFVAAAVPTLTGEKRIFFTERAENKAYKINVHTLTKETPSTAETLAALLTQKPAGIVLALTVSESPTWEEATKEWHTVASTVTWGNATPGQV